MFSKSHFKSHFWYQSYQTRKFFPNSYKPLLFWSILKASSMMCHHFTLYGIKPPQNCHCQNPRIDVQILWNQVTWKIHKLEFFIQQYKCKFSSTWFLTWCLFCEHSARNLEMTIRFSLQFRLSLNDFIGQKCLKLNLRSTFVPAWS